MKRLGFIIIIVTLLLDQFSKNWVLASYGGGSRLIEEVLPFFNLVMVWNRGVSFGMFSNHPEWMPIILTLVALAITAILFVWLFKATERFTVIAISLVIGGALGNIIDRVRFGAVVDFLDFHAYGYHWPAFNIADSAIFIGVVLLLIESIMEVKHDSLTAKGKNS